MFTSFFKKGVCFAKRKKKKCFMHKIEPSVVGRLVSDINPVSVLKGWTSFQ